MDVSFSKNRADYLLSLVAFGQSFISLFQLFLLHTGMASESMANGLRIMLTAVPTVVALFVLMKRKMMTLFCVYTLAALVLVITVSFWPHRWEIMSHDVLSLFLPVVLPTGLCAYSLRNIDVFLKTSYYISLLTAILASVYLVFFFSGKMNIEDAYSMSFSYALLLPTVVLSCKNNVASKILSLFLIIAIFALGSRGAFAVSIITFSLALLFEIKSNLIKVVLVLLVLMLVLFNDSILNFFVLLFEKIGISSRTLQLIADSEFLTHDSERGAIYDAAKRCIASNPVFGYGVWGDREFIGGYCHNIYLELLFDHGVILGNLIVVFFVLSQIRMFLKVGKEAKRIMIIMAVACIFPLLRSNSYLIDYSLSLYIGFSVNLFMRRRENFRLIF